MLIAKVGKTYDVLPQLTKTDRSIPTGKTKDVFPCFLERPVQPLTYSKQLMQRKYLLLSVEVVEEDGALLGVLTPVLDDNARAVDDLAGVTLTVKNACTEKC